MKRLSILFLVYAFLVIFPPSAWTQGDVRSATGMPIPIGAAVIWGQIELRGLKPTDNRPVISVTLLVNGSPIGTAQANDKGYYYFLQRVRDGASLLVSVGGMEVGRQLISAAGGDRYDMAINWTGNVRPTKQPGVVSAQDLYAERSDSHKILFDRASAAAKAKNLDEAAKLYSDIVAADPKDFVAWTELGTIRFSQGKTQDAESAYVRALERKPDFMVALMNLGKLQLSAKEFDKAVVTFTNAANADRNSAEAFHYLGESYLQIKQGSKAVVAMNEAIRLAPIEKADLHVRLATLYNAAGLKGQAANEYKLFLAKKPDHPEKEKLEKYIQDNGK